jgi:hypothetical protein
VTTLKHNKSKYKKQKAACPLHITRNLYNLLCNGTNEDDDDNDVINGMLAKKNTHVARHEGRNMIGIH